jgi:hypothetical protein
VQQSNNTESVLSGGKLGAIIAVCITVPSLIVVGVILYRRKKLNKRKAASTAYLEWLAAHGNPSPRPPFPPVPPIEKFGGGEAREMAEDNWAPR